MGKIQEILELMVNVSLKVMLFFIAIQVAILLESLASINYKYQCHVTECDMKVTPEHAAQIAMIQQLGITDADCLRHFKRVKLDDYLAVFCPYEMFCGLDLLPKNTKELKHLSNKTCSIFSKATQNCANFVSILRSLDVNECRKSPSTCSPGGVCLNKINHGNDCSCYPGFSRTENWEKKIVECQDINECDQTPSPCSGALEICQNSPGSFTCTCPSPGYHRLSEGSTCVDIDECSEDEDRCSTVSEVCQNSVGSFVCQCKDGFHKISEEQICQDIDECIEEPGICNDENKGCENQNGSYTCSCLPGFWSQTDESSEYIDCEDIDECAQDCKDVDDCEVPCGFIAEKCKNTIGSFECECLTGYERDDEDSSCLETGYGTEGYKAVKLCEGDGCDCGSHYMVGNYNGRNYCMNTFFLPKGNKSLYPNCDAPCCDTTCNWVQPIYGQCSSGVYPNHDVDNLWDGSPVNIHNAEKCFHSETNPEITVELTLNSSYSVNAVSILNRQNSYHRLNGLLVNVCKSQVKCIYCGQFLNSGTFWNYLACNEEAFGSKLILEMTDNEDELLNFCEILIHVNTII